MAEEEKRWTQARIEQYISDRIEEGQMLEYKAAASLDRSDGKKSEVSKDVSAMANSAGGIIIYGIAEYQDDAHKHLPEKIDPVDRTQFSKEWLEQIINSNIQPRIDGIIVHPIGIDADPTRAVYVVEIPQGHVAHQAKDHRYYRRYNFEILSMADHERRDVDGRQQFPRIEVEFEIEITQRVQGDASEFSWPLSASGARIHKTEKPRVIDQFELKIRAFNAGKIFAQYVNAFIEIPGLLLPAPLESGDEEDYWVIQGFDPEAYEKNGIEYYQRYEDNTVREIIGHQNIALGASVPNYGTARYDPILPGRYHAWSSVGLRDDFEELSLEGLYIEWETSADNAPLLAGRIAVQDIKITDKRDKAK